MSKSKDTGDESNLNEKADRFAKLISNGKEIIAIGINIITAIVLFYSKSDQSHDYDRFSLFIEILNFMVLITAIVILSQKYDLVLDESKGEIDEVIKFEKGYSLFNHSAKRQIVNDKITRINTTVLQLIKNHRAFALSLAFLYGLMVFYDIGNIKDAGAAKKDINTYKQKYDSLKKDFIKGIQYNKNAAKNDNSKRTGDTLVNKKIIDAGQILKLLNTWKSEKDSVFCSLVFVSLIKDTSLYKRNFVADLTIRFNENVKELQTEYPRWDLDSIRAEKLKNEHSILSLLPKSDLGSRQTVNYLMITVIDIFFNILSGCFLFIAFSVLFTETIENDNTTSKINYMPAFAAGGAIFLFVALSITIGFDDLPLQTLVIVTRIISGIFNGVAMALIFSRFISIEFFFKRSNILNRSYYLIGTILFLPIYAVVQPLFGLFEINYSGNQDFIKAVVLLLCLWGKIFFFLLLYTMLKKRWLHAYIFTLRFSEERISEITAKIHNIENPPKKTT